MVIPIIILIAAPGTIVFIEFLSFLIKGSGRVGKVFLSLPEVGSLIVLLSDAIYYLMKPLEILFLLTLYTFDKKPENRISKQYLRQDDREKLESLLTSEECRTGSLIQK